MEQNAIVLDDAGMLELLKRAFEFAKPDHQALSTRITLQSSIDELGMESVAALEMAGFIEEELDIQFHDNELTTIRGMDSLARLIRKHIDGKGGVK